jgi:DUF1009 family protein
LQDDKKNPSLFIHSPFNGVLNGEGVPTITIFNLKSVVEFLESSGFHVREANEMYADRVFPIHTLGVEVSPKDPEAEFSLQSVLRFFDGNGFIVAGAREIEKTVDPFSPACSSTVKPERALEAIAIKIRDEAKKCPAC